MKVECSLKYVLLSTFETMEVQSTVLSLKLKYKVLSLQWCYPSPYTSTCN